MMASEQGSDLDVMAWLRENTRLVSIGGAVIVLAAAGYWIMVQSRAQRAANAERSLLTAQQSVASNNTELARTDLKRIVDRYSGTSAGTEAAMLLTQIDYQFGKYQEGLDVARSALPKAGSSGPAMQGLIADGLSMMGKGADAGSAYEEAAKSSTFANERSYFLAKAARSFEASGKAADAKRIWTDLAKDEKSPSVAAEARVRLAELEAKPASKS